MNNLLKEVSIIIPMYNCEITIERCLDSILSQTYKKYEVILVDDGSSDRTSKICEKYTRKYENFLYFYQKNSGPSLARLNGVHKAKNECITFVDADDYIDSDYLKKLVTGFKEGYINGTNYRIIDDSNSNKEIFKRKSEDIDSAIPDIFNKKIGGYSWGYLFEKSKIIDDYFDLKVKFMEDTLFLLNYSVNFKGFNFIDGVYYNYVYNKDSLSKNPDRIVENILSVNYVIDVSNKKIRNLKISVDLSDTLFSIINSQLFEIKKMSDLKSIMFNEQVKDILCNVKSKKIIFKIYKLSFRLNNCLLIYLYIRIRSLIKKAYRMLRSVLFYVINSNTNV